MTSCFKSVTGKQGEEISPLIGKIQEFSLAEKYLDMGDLHIEVPILEEHFDYPYALEYKGPPLTYAVPKVEPLIIRPAEEIVKPSYSKITHMVVSDKDHSLHDVSKLKPQVTNMQKAKSPKLSSSAGKFPESVLHPSERPKIAIKVELPLGDTLLSKNELLSYTSFSWIRDDVSQKS